MGIVQLTAVNVCSQAHDLSKEMPEKLHELQRLFLIEAVKYNVLPLDDRRPVRFNSDLAGRPTLIKENQTLAQRHAAPGRKCNPQPEK